MMMLMMRLKRFKLSNLSIIIYIFINGIVKLCEEKKYNLRRRKLFLNFFFDFSVFFCELCLINGSLYYFCN